MARDYDHLFKLLIIGDSGKYYLHCRRRFRSHPSFTCSCMRVFVWVMRGVYDPPTSRIFSEHRVLFDCARAEQFFFFVAFLYPQR